MVNFISKQPFQLEKLLLFVYLITISVLGAGNHY